MRISGGGGRGGNGSGERHVAHRDGDHDGDHDRGHRRHFRSGFYGYSSPYYDDYSDYSYSNGDGGCDYYYVRWQRTGSHKWKVRYYDCIG